MAVDVDVDGFGGVIVRWSAMYLHPPPPSGVRTMVEFGRTKSVVGVDVDVDVVVVDVVGVVLSTSVLCVSGGGEAGLNVKSLSSSSS